MSEPLIPLPSDDTDYLRRRYHVGQQLKLRVLSKGRYAGEPSGNGRRVADATVVEIQSYRLIVEIDGQRHIAYPHHEVKP